MTFDVEITLLTKVIITNEYLQEEINYTQTKILAIKKSVGRREFYLAKQTELQPTILFEINAFEYDGQEELLFNDKKYKIIKTYEKNNMLELTCEEVKL